MTRYGEVMEKIKIMLRQMDVGERFEARDLALIIDDETDYPVSSIKVAKCLSKLGAVKRINRHPKTAKWEVQPKVVLL